MARESDIVSLLRQYAMAFPAAKIDAGTWAIYARALKTLEIKEIEAAMLKLIRTCKFFPSIAEIFEAAESMRGGDGTPSAAEAWEEVMRLARTRHVYEPWKYSCQAVKRAAECFGRVELCTLDEKSVNVARAQFMKIYDELRKRRKDRCDAAEVLSLMPGNETIAQLAKTKELRMELTVC